MCHRQDMPEVAMRIFGLGDIGGIYPIFHTATDTFEQRQPFDINELRQPGLQHRRLRHRSSGVAWHHCDASGWKNVVNSWEPIFFQ